MLLGDAYSLLAFFADEVEVPLANLAGDVASGLEPFGDGQFGQGQWALVVILDAEALLIASGEDAGAGRDALRSGHVATGEAHAVAGHRIEIRRADVFVRSLDA